jgi:signal transduction histidine kinase
MPTPVARTLFAIIQEAVGNARKHAGEATVTVRVMHAPTELIVLVEDSGRGFELQQVQERYTRSGSLGLVNMKERAELIGASWAISSVPGEGTTVSVRVPLEGNEPEI